MGFRTPDRRASQLAIEPAYEGFEWEIFYNGSCRGLELSDPFAGASRSRSTPIAAGGGGGKNGNFDRGFDQYSGRGTRDENGQFTAHAAFWRVAICSMLAGSLQTIHQANDGSGD